MGEYECCRLMSLRQSKSNVECLYVHESGMLWAARIRKPDYDVSIVNFHMMKNMRVGCCWHWFRGSAMLIMASLILLEFPSLAKEVSCSPAII